ncbi:hypothetical protein PYW07_004166 [Mythimna separata]|uniref:Uncharacterized protein n=1 Tax=Mythimna separata TaxID=271217 RepID=A0AAD8DUU2_MYTSE|nr:hypothetical protein PYW07_004166 [Mythimna separata]
MSYKLCDLVNNEPFVGGALKNAGMVCPLPSGYHAVENITAPTKNFPNVFPFEKGRVEVSLNVTDTKEQVLLVTIVASFKQKP